MRLERQFAYLKQKVIASSLVALSYVILYNNVIEVIITGSLVSLLYAIFGGYIFWMGYKMLFKRKRRIKW